MLLAYVLLFYHLQWCWIGEKFLFCYNIIFQLQFYSNSNFNNPKTFLHDNKMFQDYLWIDCDLYFLPDTALRSSKCLYRLFVQFPTPLIWSVKASSLSGAELIVKGCHSNCVIFGIFINTQSPAECLNVSGFLITSSVTLKL